MSEWREQITVDVTVRMEAEQLARLAKPQRDAVLLGISRVLGAQADGDAPDLRAAIDHARGT